MFNKGHIKLSISAICIYFKYNIISVISEINVRECILIPEEIKLFFKEDAKPLRERLTCCNSMIITCADIFK